MRFPFPLLAADIGGTNVRFAVFEKPGDPVRRLGPQTTVDHANAAAAARAALKETPLKPRSMLVCAAGPVVGRGVKLTNAAWNVEGAELADALGLEQGLLFNDFEALALSIPALRPEWLRQIGPPTPAASGPRIIHGPGTGLGTSALIESVGRWLAIASEASHTDFAPVTRDEIAFWPFVERAHGRLTPETLISGRGFERLHDARARAAGRPPAGLRNAEIVARGLADSGSDEADTIRAFWRLAARFAGDMALTFVASGGVILAGGILPRIVDLLDEAAFRVAFENHAPYEGFTRAIPVWLLVGRDPVLAGMAGIAADPDRFAIDYASRAWR